ADVAEFVEHSSRPDRVVPGVRSLGRQSNPAVAHANRRDGDDSVAVESKQRAVRYCRDRAVASVRLAPSSPGGEWGEQDQGDPANDHGAGRVILTDVWKTL